MEGFKNKAFGQATVEAVSMHTEAVHPELSKPASASTNQRTWKDYGFYFIIAFLVLSTLGSIARILEDPDARRMRLVNEAKAAKIAAIQNQKEAKIAAIQNQKAEYAKTCGKGKNISAFVMIQNSVKSRLRSPSTASFPYSNDAVVTPIGDCKWRIVSYVDAQNGFGAMIRTYWTGTIKHYPNEGSWRTLSVNIGG